MTTVVATGKDSLSADNSSVYNVELQYEKILKLRDEIFADKHPTLKLLKQVSPISKPSTTPASAPVATVNGHPKTATKLPASTQNGTSFTHASPSAPPISKSTAIQPSHNAQVGSSGIDPVFLEKSHVLVRAEIRQKRQRIERALDEQLIQKRASARQNVLEEYALPDFNVTEVLRKAHDIVKPVKVLVQDAVRRTASSNDSFDENTFYSSQMDSMSDQTDASAKKPAQVEERATHSEPMEVDSGNTDEPANSHPQVQSDDPTKAPTLQQPLSQQAQIARLEEELRRLRGEGKPTESRKTPPITREEEVTEEPPYSPPDVRASPPVQPVSNHVGIPTAHQNQRQDPPRRSSKALEPQAREFLRRNELAPSPVSNDMRIVRNHITSPLAPQPARVSPLAVSKEPPVSQNRNRPRARDSGAGLEVAGNRHSPNQPVQPLNPRKRRRRTNSGEMTRNVAARREAASPEVRIKEEPVSPQQRPTALGAWRPPIREEVPRPIVVDNASPRQVTSERSDQQSRRYERPSRVFAVDQGRPLTPSGYSGGRFVEVREDPDLRRIVSAKQVRPPMSPIEQYSAGQLYSTRATSQMHLPQSSQDPRQFRAASHVQISQAGQDSARQYRASAQPPPTSVYGGEHSPSPLARQVQRSSPQHGSVAMAPPPRRIVVDQFGNRFVEAVAPAARERQVSIAPIARPAEHESRYEVPIRAPEVRHTPIDVNHGEPRYVQRPASPVSPRYVEYPPQAAPTRARSIVYLDNDRHQEGRSGQRSDASMVHYIEYPTTARPEEFPRPREVTRMSSVRPVGIQYETPREQVSRIPSVRPDQGRVVSLNGRREDIPQIGQHISVRPEEIYMRQPVPVVDDRPRYQYVPEPQDQRYTTNGAYDDGIIYETNRGAARRIVQ